MKKNHLIPAAIINVAVFACELITVVNYGARLELVGIVSALFVLSSA